MNIAGIQAADRAIGEQLWAQQTGRVKLLPLAAELLNVPSIPTGQPTLPRVAGLPAELDLQSLVADLSPSQKRTLTQMLSRSLAS